MFETFVTVVGTALNTPEWRQVSKNNAVVANFRVASHPRRFDRNTGQWVDAPSFRIKVNCWRRLAENVCASIIAGDPVIVYGRLVTRDWKTEQGESRSQYELEADNVGHDLNRGQSKFKRVKPESIAPVVDDAEADARVNGELSRVLTGEDMPQVPRVFGESMDDEFDENLAMRELVDQDADALAILRGAGLEPVEPEEDGDGGGEGGGESPAEHARRRRGRAPVPV